MSGQINHCRAVRHHNAAAVKANEIPKRIGNGGWIGQGLGQGKGKLFYLPAAHTDFIAAVVAEEVGLLGIALLLLLYGIVAWRANRRCSLTSCDTCSNNVRSGRVSPTATSIIACTIRKSSCRP